MVKISKPKVRVKKSESVRERAEKQRQKQSTQPRRKKLVSTATKPAKGLGRILTKEYSPLMIKNKKAGSLLNKRVRFIPKYFKSSFEEIKLVQWPTPKQAFSLTMSVLVFSVSIAVFVQLLGFGFDKLFKEVILK